MTARTQRVLLIGCAVLLPALLAFRVDVLHAVLLALGAAVVVLGSAALHQSVHPELLHGRGLAADGARRDVAALSWTLVGRNGRVSESAVRHLRTTTERRLARVGLSLDPDAPEWVQSAAQQALGTRALRTLRAADQMPTMEDVAHTVGVLESLVTRTASPSPTVSPTVSPAHGEKSPR